MKKSLKEEQELLLKFNQTAADFHLEKSLSELFEIQCLFSPDSVAVEFEGSTLTYSALNKKANKIASWLRSNNATHSTVVGLCFERSVNLAAAILGILKSGGAYVPFDPSYPADRIS